MARVRCVLTSQTHGRPLPPQRLLLHPLQLYGRTVKVSNTLKGMSHMIQGLGGS